MDNKFALNVTDADRESLSGILELFKPRDLTITQIIEVMIDAIYNHPDHPENHSAIYYDKESAYVFNGTKWELMPLPEVVDIMKTKAIEALKKMLSDEPK